MKWSDSNRKEEILRAATKDEHVTAKTLEASEAESGTAVYSISCFQGFGLHRAQVANHDSVMSPVKCEAVA